MIVVDFTSSIPRGDGYTVRYKNPIFWDGTVRECDYFKSTDPKIIAAHEKAGVPAWKGSLKESGVVEPQENVKVGDSDVRQEQEEEGLQQEAKEEVKPEELSWNELRSKAKELTDEPVKSKEQALEVLRNSLIQ